MAPAAAYLNRGQAALADASRAHWKAAGWPDADAAFRAAGMKDSREAGRHRLSAGK